MMSARVPGLMPLANALLAERVVVEIDLVVKTQPQVRVPELNLAVVVVPDGVPVRYLLPDTPVRFSLKAVVAVVKGRIQYKRGGFIDEVSSFP